jgi:hypothetical protein
LRVFKEIKEEDKNKNNKEAKEVNKKKMIIIDFPFLLLRRSIFGFDSYNLN